MKNFRLISVLLLTVLMLSGCKKDDKTVSEATTEEVASIMVTSFCTGSAGTLTQMEDAVEMAMSSGSKSMMYDSSFTISNTPGATITYQYVMNYDFGFVNLNTFQLAYDASGNYSSPSISGDISTSGTLGLSGLSIYDLSAFYSLNGNALRNGTFTMNIGDNNSISGTVTTTITNFKFLKTTGLCESGTANIVVSGSTSSGKDFSLTGILVYEGNHVGSLTINGKTYSVNLTSGVFGLRM